MSFFCSNAAAEEEIQKPDNSYLTFYLDNDIFTGTDLNYTNGARISYISDGQEIFNWSWLDHFLHRFSGDGSGNNPIQTIWGFEDPDAVEYSYGISLTQLMYTPEDIDALTAPPGERPYAGWAGLGFSLHVRDERAINTIEINLGVVGPESLAQDSQDFIHDLRDIEKFQGWDSQVPTEVTFNIHFDQKRRFTDLRKLDLPLGLNIDGFLETGYSLGNFMTEAHAGFYLRLGWNLPVEFSDPRLTLTAHTQKLFNDGYQCDERFSFYIFAGGRGTAVLHDITLDGPLFRNFDTGVEKEPLVGELYVGAGFRIEDWEFSYVQTIRSKQFKSQSDSQPFGSIAIRKRF